MLLDNPLSVVAPTLDAPVLAVLARADEAFSGRQVHQLVGAGTEQAVRNALERLVSQGVVLRTTAGRAHMYRMNHDHLAASHLVALANLRDALFERWREQVRTWPIQPHVVMLFGSAARGEMRLDSDLDVLVVAEELSDDLRDAVSRFEEATVSWTGNDTRVLLVTPERVSRDEPTLVAAAEEGVTITGAEGWLRRLLRGQVDPGA